MKLKHLFLISCLLGTVTFLNAQSEAYWTGPATFWTYIDCDNDGVPEDFIMADIEIYHQVFHTKDEEPVWSRNQVKGEGLGLISGDIFMYHTINVRTSATLVTWKFILRSENAKYTGEMSFDGTWPPTIIRLNCK